MTGKTVFENALSYLMEKPGDDRAFSAHALNLINGCIDDLKPVTTYRNATVNKIQTIDGEITADEEICHAISLYLAAHFLRDDLDDAGYINFYRRYESAKSALIRYIFTDIQDVYGGQNDE
ncbi:MAG: hypothetical protein IKU25_03260 [Clostridia bacterium]|nr:hypothetical protein [Clostridia bacterium]